MPTTQTLPSRRTVLVQINIRWLEQALRLLDRIDDVTYAASRAGAHLRHVLDFYRCFLDGLESSHIDYDARRREQAIECRCDAAGAAARAVIHAFESNPEFNGERLVWVRMEDAGSHGVRECFMESSISRELQFLSSHAVHHFALIAMTLRAEGVPMDPDFGMAPSTLRHLASKTAEAA